MTTDSQILLNKCLYFTANALARSITRMADEAFIITGISPSHAFLLMLVIEEPGTSQKELVDRLQLRPSTITRFVDALVQRRLITRKTDGKLVRIHPTSKGEKMLPNLKAAWKSLHRRYSKILGTAEGDGLTEHIFQAHCLLEKSIQED